MKDNTSVNHEQRRYISYFQSVLTIGIMNDAVGYEDAEIKANEKLNDKNNVNYCVFEQTPFELTDTEVWDPEFETGATLNGLNINFNPDIKTKNIIATRLGKNIAEMTDSDYTNFVKESIEVALKKS
jgi:hypothetical protein